MSKILVTGATGFIGSLLVKTLSSEGYNVRCLVRKNSDYKKLNFKNVEFWFGDTTDKMTIKGICDGVDTVFHLAAIGDINAVSKRHFDEYKRVNVDGTRNIFLESLNSGVKNYFHFSSVAAMGTISKSIISPDAKCHPKLPYEISKHLSEKVISNNRKGKMRIFIIRPSMVYDWTDEEQKEATKIIKMVKRKIVLVPGSGNNILHIINRKSLVRKLIHMLESRSLSGVYIMIEESVTFNDFIRRVADHYKIKNVRIFHVPKFLIYYPTLVMESLARPLGFVPYMTTKRLEAIYSI